MGGSTRKAHGQVNVPIQTVRERGRRRLVLHYVTMYVCQCESAEGTSSHDWASNNVPFLENVSQHQHLSLETAGHTPAFHAFSKFERVDFPIGHIVKNFEGRVKVSYSRFWQRGEREPSILMRTVRGYDALHVFVETLFSDLASLAQAKGIRVTVLGIARLQVVPGDRPIAALPYYQIDHRRDKGHP